MIQKQRKDLNRGLKLLAAVVLMAVLGMSNIPGMSMVSTVHAAEGVKTITGLGTGAIGNPNKPESDSSWLGSYVYYGKYNNNPVKYRVLDVSTDRFNSLADNIAGVKKMFLDCDSVLFKDAFRDNLKASYANVWNASDLYESLNSLNTEINSLLKTGFTSAEGNAIAASYIGSHPLTYDSSESGAVNVTNWTQRTFVNYTALKGEKIFLLDAEDASNNAYGYSTTDDPASNRKKVARGGGCGRPITTLIAMPAAWTCTAEWTTTLWVTQRLE